MMTVLRGGTVLVWHQSIVLTLHCTPIIYYLAVEFLVLVPHQNLSFFYLVAFFHSNPGHAAGDLRIHADFVMSDNVSARRKHGAARDVTAFRRGSRDFHFRCLRSERTVSQRD